MNNITLSQLVTINLKFGSHAKPLKLLAFSDLASNALFLLNKGSTTTEVAKETARLIGLATIDEGLVNEALQLLRDDKKVKLSGKVWELQTEARELIQRENENSENLLQEVLKRHFPASIDSAILKTWFLSAASDFFGFNGAEWVKSISKNSKTEFARPQTIKELLLPSIQRAKLNTQEKILVDAFGAFLYSEDPSDQRYIMNLGFAMLSAQLVAADVGADPITIDEIRDSTFILDTNVLFAIQLDTHRLAKSIKALSAALKDIGAELVLLEPTKQEYKRVFVGVRGEVSALFRDYPNEVVLDADSGFIKTGVSRGCQNESDFERFFETIKSPPQQLSSGIKIVETDYPEIDAEVRKAESDRGLHGAIQQSCLKLRGRWDKRPKTETALKHDAALIRVVEMMQTKKSKTWILSLDRGLRVCAAERSGPHGIPSVLMFDGLIQILAVNSGGPNRDAADYAPLMANIILNRCSPSERTYTLQDLRWLHTLQQRVVDFSPADIKKIANVVTQHRLSGATSDDKKLQLSVNRIYLEVKQDYDEKLSQAHERLKGAETEKQEIKEELQSTKQDLTQYKATECIRKERWKLFRALLWRIPVSVAIAAVAYYLAVAALPEEGSGWMEWTIGVATFVLFIVGFLLKPIRNYRAGTNICIVDPDSALKGAN